MVNDRNKFGKIREQDSELYLNIKKSIIEYKLDYGLPGIDDETNLEVFILQIIDSQRRIKYIQKILEREHTNLVADPKSKAFDPLKAAVYFLNNQMIDEACWLIFLSINFGKNKKTNWALVKAFYGNLGDSENWTWEKITNDKVAFKSWIFENYQKLKTYGNFGNHRKYCSLKPNIFSKVILSYIDWIETNGGHSNLFNKAINSSKNDPKDSFLSLYKQMNDVYSFGRMGKFDYLCMIGKMKLANITPGEIFLSEATGPKDGCFILFGHHNKADINLMNDKLTLLEQKINLEFGMQILEDAICNWQKNPNKYIYFNG